MSRRCSALFVVAPFALLAFLAFPASPTRAESKVDPEVQKHFQLANDLYKEFKYSDALVEYDAAYKLSKGNYKILYNRAQCLVMVKREPEAIDSFERYLKDGADEIPSERRTQVTQEITRLKDRLGTIVVPSAPAGTAFEVDGNPVAANATAKGAVLTAGAGTHEVVVRPPNGAIPLIKPVKVVAGEEVAVDVDFSPSMGASTAPSNPPAPTNFPSAPNDAVALPPPPAVTRAPTGLVSPAIVFTLALGGASETNGGNESSSKVLGAAELGIGYRAGSFVELGIYVGGASGKRGLSSPSSPSNADYTYGNYGIRLRLHPVRARRVDGWFGFDFGGFKETWKLPHDDISISTSAFALGGGLDFALARSWALGGFLRYLGTSSARADCTTSADLNCANIPKTSRGYLEFGLRIVFSIPIGQKAPPTERGTALLPAGIF